MSGESQPGLAKGEFGGPDGTSTPDSAGAGSSKRKRLDQGATSNGSAYDNPISLSNPSNYPRKRVSIACEVCRVRKTRCDAVKPSCSFCSQLGVECTYRKPTLGNRPEAGPKEDPLTKIDRRLERIESLLLEQDDTVGEVYSSASQAQDGSSPGASPRLNASLPVHQPPAPPAPSQSPVGPYRPMPKTSRSGISIDDLSLMGLSLLGMSRLENSRPPPTLMPLARDVSEEYIDIEARQGEELFGVPESAHPMDLSNTTRWRLQQSYVKNMLPWFPLFDDNYCMEIINVAASQNFTSNNLETSLALFIFALGAFSKADHHTADAPQDFPGIQYFIAATRILSNSPISHGSILAIQCRLLQAFFLLLGLRPLQAYDAVRNASSLVISLLHLKKRREADLRLKEALIRAYWGCFIVEHELKGHMTCTTNSLHMLHETVPLPLGDHEQAGLYWFLGEISLRRIFTDVQDGVGFLTYTTYAPLIAQELLAQLDEWYKRLPSRIKFPFGTDPIMDLPKAFLRCQYYSILFVVHWAAVVQLLTKEPPNQQERNHLLSLSAKAVEYGVIYLTASESLMMERHVMLFADFVGCYAITLMMSCAYCTPILKPILHPETVTAIRKGHGYLTQWSDNPGLNQQKLNVEAVMRQGGLLPNQEAVMPMQNGTPMSATQTPSAPPSAHPGRTSSTPLSALPRSASGAGMMPPGAPGFHQSPVNDPHMMAVDAVLEHGRHSDQRMAFGEPPSTSAPAPMGAPGQGFHPGMPHQGAPQASQEGMPRAPVWNGQQRPPGPPGPPGPPQPFMGHPPSGQPLPVHETEAQRGYGR